MLEEKCEYCTFESDCGKSFMFQLGFPGEEMVMGTIISAVRLMILVTR